MEKLKFSRTKYGKELLIDACNEYELDIVADTMVLNFYTLIFLEKGKGTYYLDTEKIHLEDNLVLFIKPGQIIMYAPQNSLSVICFSLKANF